MQKTIESLKNRFASIRTGRASTDLVSHIKAEYYGSVLPLQQLATVSLQGPRTLLLSVFDANAVKAVEKAIMTSDLGHNPQTEGTMIRLNLPDLTEERRKELVKHIRSLVEESKISLRNIRRDHLEQFKKIDDPSDDEVKGEQNKVQKVIDSYSRKIDETFAAKEKDIMAV